VEKYGNLDEDRCLSPKEVAALLGVSYHSIWRMSKDGRFPKPVRIGKSIRWPMSVIREYLDQGGSR